MRISSTYIERAIIIWGQIILLSYFIIAIIFLFDAGFDFSKLELESLVIYLIIAPIIVLPLFGFADFLILHFKFKPMQLKIKNGLYIGNSRIEFEQIKSITPVTYNLGRFDYKLLEFCFNDGNISYILCKPQLLLDHLKDKPTKTFIQLKGNFPELSRFIRPKKEI